VTADLDRRRRDFDDLVREVAEPVRRYLRRRADAETADDVFSETMLVCWRRLGSVPPPGERLPWAYVAAGNCLRNAQRAARRRERLTARIIALDPPASSVSAAGGSEADDRDTEHELLRDALAALRAPDAEVLRLWAWEELSPTDIGAVLGISANAATIRLHRARRRLRERLERHDAPGGHIPREGRTTP